jgi:hypothetical protein
MRVVRGRSTSLWAADPWHFLASPMDSDLRGYRSTPRTKVPPDHQADLVVASGRHDFDLKAIVKILRLAAAEAHAYEVYLMVLADSHRQPDLPSLLRRRSLMKIRDLAARLRCLHRDQSHQCCP